MGIDNTFTNGKTEARAATERNLARAGRQLDAVLQAADKATRAEQIWQFAAMAVLHGNRIDKLTHRLGETAQC